MKKFLYTLLLLAAPVLMASCSNDDELPQVDMSIDYSGATETEGVLYIVSGDKLSIDAINVTPLKGYGKATIGATAYYWNYQYIGTSIEEPFGIAIDTEDMPVGDYVLQINSTVYQVDRSVGMAYFTIPVKIVDQPDDVPGGDDGSGEIVPDVDMRAGVAPTTR